ncbi:MAG: A24 family peptidase [Magnetospiraceae bacterium]
MLWLQTALFLIMPFCLIFSFFHDLATLTIPNWISILLAASFLPLALVSGMGLTDIALHYGFGIIALGLGILLFALKIMGGGDSKLIAALGVWLGWKLFLPFLLIMAIAGGALSLAILLARKRWQGERPVRFRWLAEGIFTGGKVPYGVAIAIGGLYLVSHYSVYPQF